MASVIGFGAGIVTTLVAAALGAREAPGFGLALLAVSVVAVAGTTTLVGALAAAAQCWALWDGFLLNDLGRLTAERGGWQGLALLLLCAVAAVATATGYRHVLHGVDPDQAGAERVTAETWARQQEVG